MAELTDKKITPRLDAVVLPAQDSENEESISGSRPKRSFRQRIKGIVWDSLDYSPEERKFISKIDFFILYDAATAL
jgi:ACS family pantothenate transporter-like MFS transporter